MQVKDYLKRFKKVIMRRVGGSNLLSSIVAAHAIFEAAGDNGTIGNSVLAKKYNNDVRMLADKDWNGPKVLFPVRSFTRFKELVPLTWFRYYANAEQAIEDRIKMLIGSVGKWPTAAFHHDTVKAQAAIMQLVVGNGDQYYAERLVEIIEKFKLQKLDRQWQVERVVRMCAWCCVIGYAIVRWDDWVPWR